MTSDKNSNKHEPVEQVDDLTRFLDEDFDTDEVDLFEFTSEEDSPLTQLKSIVLSLDWEITDDTLADLAEEINHLKEQELFQADKVSQVYLQGLDKIGQYIQSEGAYAHRNAIKLLLTLFYDFEKILSSETITGTEITALLKADVRKFKILQYQIAQKHGAEAEFKEEKASGLVLTDSEALQGIQAAILELDWEVTDEGLAHMDRQLENLKTTFEENRYIQVLVQGLFSLNTYINEERAKTHPEAFSLLHTFCRGLEALIEKKDLSEEERQEIVIDNVNRLNNLKNIIAGVAVDEVDDLDQDAIEPVADEVEDDFFEEDLDIETEGMDDFAAAEDEIDLDEAVAEQADIGDDLDIDMDDSSAVGPTEALDFDEEEEAPLLAEEDTGEELDIAPALSDSGDESSLDLEEAPPEELEEKLEFFFGSDETAAESEPLQEEEPVAGLDEAPPFLEEEESFDDLEIAPALADSTDEEGLDLDEAPPEELEEKLEFFFGADEESPALEEGEEKSVTDQADVPEAPVELEEAPEPEEEEEDLDIVPALAGSPEESGFGTDEDMAAEEPPGELEEKLEFFFGKDESLPEPQAKEEAAAEPKPVEEPEALFEEEEEEPDIAPALADSPSEEGLDLDEAPPEELEGNLEAFFGKDEAPEPQAEEEAAAETQPAEEPEALFEEEEEEPDIAPALADSPSEEGFELEESPPEEIEEKLEFFFGEDKQDAGPTVEEVPTVEPQEEVSEGTEDEEVLLTPSLEEAPFSEEISSAEEYQVAVDRIRADFAEKENALRQEIESLKEEIQSLRVELQSR